MQSGSGTTGSLSFGLLLNGIPAGELGTFARCAEELGFESVWATDHVVVPYEIRTAYPHHQEGTRPDAAQAVVPRSDPLASLSAVAAASSTLKLGTAIFVLPLRDVFTTARALTTIDGISNGRLMFGVGTGWLREEFEILQREFATRGALIDEQLEVLQLLWRDKTPEFHGRFHDFNPIGFEPKPVNRTIPIHVGGSSAAALRRAALAGDGWIASRSEGPDAAVRNGRTILALRAASERADDPFELTAIAPAGTIDPGWLRHIAAAGFQRAILHPWPPPRGTEWAGSNWRALCEETAEAIRLLP